MLALALLLCSFLQVPVVQAVAATQPAKRVALVIGNGAYASASLPNPVNDATDMATLLKRIGFDVILRRDATRLVMDEAVREFHGKLKKNKGVGLFYYAGHGVQVHGQNFLVPVDAKIESEGDVLYTSIDAGWVLAKMEDAQNPVNIVVLDACRNNPFTRGFRSAEKGLAQMPSPTGSIIAYATAPGDVARDGEGRNGLFTYHLLRHLSEPGLTIEEVFAQVRHDVWVDSGKQQTPWTSSSLMGRISLASGDTTIVSPPPPPANGHGLNLKRKQLEYERNEVEALKAQVEENRKKIDSERRLAEERARLDAERQRIELERQTLMALAAKPSTPDPPTRVKNSLGMEFVWIAPGTFDMGSPSGEEGRDPDETQHPVTLTRGYYLQTTEVTQGQWRAVTGSNPSQFSGCGYNCPVENVSWNDVQAFIGKLNEKGDGTYRLPTEAEWEYACRAGTQTSRFWGNNPAGACRFANVADRALKRKSPDWTIHECEDGYAETAPVKSYAPNPWGLYDMMGNVWEWCADWHAAFSAEAVTDPQGPPGGSYLVYRGGSWYNRPAGVRSADRGGGAPTGSYGNLGFRLVKSD